MRTWRFRVFPEKKENITVNYMTESENLLFCDCRCTQGAPFGDSMGFPFIALKFIPYYFLLRCVLYDYVMFIPFDLIQRPRLGNLLCFGNDITYTTSFPGFSPTRPLSLSVGRVGENPGNEVAIYIFHFLSFYLYFYQLCMFCFPSTYYVTLFSP